MRREPRFARTCFRDNYLELLSPSCENKEHQSIVDIVVDERNLWSEEQGAPYRLKVLAVRHHAQAMPAEIDAESPERTLATLRLRWPRNARSEVSPVMLRRRLGEVKCTQREPRYRDSRANDPEIGATAAFLEVMEIYPGSAMRILAYRSRSLCGSGASAGLTLRRFTHT
jgi:hypothetical protein